MEGFMEKRIIEVEERLPLLPTIPLSLQHLFAMFGSTVLVPFLLHVDPATCLFMNGVGTLLYLFICKWKLPAYLGSSFAFISPVLAVTATEGMTYADAQSGFICFGLSFMILALLVKKIGTSWIDVLFPPAAMGSIVAIIGLELAPLAMSMSGFSGEAQGMTNAMAVMISMFTLIVTILATGPRIYFHYSDSYRRHRGIYPFHHHGRRRFFQCGRERMVCRPHLLFAPL